MNGITYESLALDWTPDKKQDQQFNAISIFVVILFLIFGVLVSSINIPVEKKSARTVVPERIARFILQKQKQKTIKPKPKPVPKPKLLIKPKRKKVLDKPLTKKQKTARKKASNSGLLALGNELADLIDTKSISKQVGKKITTKKTITKKTSVNTDILEKGVTAGSGAIGLTDGPVVLARTQLSKQERLSVRQAITTKELPSKLRRKTYRGEGLRSDEEITIIMDQNKNQLHSLYRRALRRDPSLKGKLVLSITILPSGEVSKVVVRSSELNNKSLEKRIIARIKRFNFGAREVEKVTVTYPIEFLPS